MKQRKHVNKRTKEFVTKPKKKLNGLKPYPSSNTFKNKNKNLGAMKILKGKDNKNEGNQARSASVGRAKFKIKVCSAKGISF